MATFFIPLKGTSLYLHIAGAIILGLLFLFALTKVPTRWRKPIVIAITFIAGLFYLIEFIIPSSKAMNPVRKTSIAAERLVSTAAHDLRIISAHEKQGKSNGANNDLRLARVRTSLDEALVKLKTAASVLDEQIPIVDRKLEVELRKVASFRKAHNLSNEMVEFREVDEEFIKKRNISSDLIIMNGPKPKIVSSRNAKNIINWSESLYVASRDINEAISRVEETRAALRGSNVDYEHLVNALTVGYIVEVIENGEKVKKQIPGAMDAIARARGGTIDNFLTPYKEVVANIYQVVGAFAFGLGLYNLLRFHGKAIIKKQPGWYSGLAFYISVFAMATLGLFQKYTEPGLAKDLSTTLYNIIFDGGLAMLQATMFSLVAFYIVSAAYRSFRIKSGEAMIMMTAAFVIMLATVPVGMAMTQSFPAGSPFRLENIGDWILNVPNMAAQRGMQFGISVGGLAMALRIWLSLERGSYFDKQM